MATLTAGAKEPGESTRIVLPAPVWSDTEQVSKSARQFGEQVEKAVEAKDGPALGRLFDFRGMLRNAIEDFPFDAKTKRDIESGFMDSIDSPAGISAQIASADSYDLLRTGHLGKYDLCLFRFLKDDAVNYHACLVEDRDGAPVARNLYIYLAGEWITETLRREIAPLAARQNQGWIQRLVSSESEYLRAMPEREQITKAITAGQFQVALDQYKRLPDSVQRAKNVMFQRMQASMQIGDQQYLEAIDDFRKQYPNDACLDLVMIDGCFLRRDFDEAIQCLDRLDKSLGGDPYLDFLRGAAYMSKGDFPQALAVNKRGIKQAPEMLDLYWGRVTILLAAKQHEETAKTLNFIEKKFEIGFGDVREIPEYRDFAASEPGKQWLADHGF